MLGFSQFIKKLMDSDLTLEVLSCQPSTLERLERGYPLGSDRFGRK
jgi:hypothetical protein